MARCCGGSACACLIEAGAHIQIQGSGAPSDPFVVVGDTDLRVQDNLTFNLTLNGAGTAASPWTLVVAFASSAKLDDVPDVNAPAPVNGHVLGWDSSTSKWTSRAPTTAASGSVLHDASLTGDGSGGSVLAVNEDPNGYLATSVTGLGLSDVGKNRIIRHYADEPTRAVATPIPDLNAITMIDNHPGIQYYWTGTQWLPVTNAIAPSFGPAMLPLSGAYVDGTPAYLFTRTIDTTTDAVGNFDILSAATLGTAAGVLSVSYQETGSFPYKAMAYADVNRIAGTAYRLDGSLYALAPITGMVTAFAY